MISHFFTYEFVFVLQHITVVNSSDNGKYLISEQGYAGFEIFLEIYFKGLPANDPVRKVRIEYDLFDATKLNRAI